MQVVGDARPRQDCAASGGRFGRSAVHARQPPEGAVELLVGPEGGLAPHEQERARSAGFRPLRMGPRVLRTETAAVAALALLQGLFGDLRGE